MYIDSSASSDKSTKRVLMICYGFPPMLRAGALHSYLFAKALPQFGWHPVVLTVRGRRDLERDDNLLRELPRDVRVFRTTTFDPVGGFERWRDRKCGPSRGPALRRGPRTKIRVEGRLGWAEKVKRALLAPVSTPDYLISWFPFAVASGAWLISEYDIDVVFSTSPPHSAHFIGFALSKLLRKPWVVEFRDPWVDMWTRYAESRCQLRKKVESFLEKIIVTHASAVIANTPTNKEMLIRRYGARKLPRVDVITNAYDADGMAHIENSPFSKFTICHAGTFYPRVNPYYFFEELSRWYHGNSVSRQKEIDENMQVLLVGTTDPTTRRVVRDLDLNNFVKVTERLPLARALEIAKSSDLLLVSMGFDARAGHWIPLKLYTYLGCRKPILALGPEGDAIDIVRKTRSGFAITSKANGAIAEILEKGYQQKRVGKQPFEEDFDFDDAEIRKYEKIELTRKLVGLFDRIA